MEVTSSIKSARDYKLVKQAVYGDQKAYYELMNLYWDSLYFMLLKMTNNEQDADDLTIEAFGKAFKNLPQYTPDFAFSTWLFKIANNNCVDFMRKKKKNFSFDKPIEHEYEQGQELVNTLPSQTLDPEEKFIRDQKIKLMRGIVEKLKPHYRELIELRYFNEFSYEEISEKLDLPLGTVKTQLFRAREFLYNILKHSQENI